jgi:hypothetical protein
MRRYAPRREGTRIESPGPPTRSVVLTASVPARLDREFGADFGLARFRRRAVWNDAAGRVASRRAVKC